MGTATGQAGRPRHSPTWGWRSLDTICVLLCLFQRVAVRDQGTTGAHQNVVGLWPWDVVTSGDGQPYHKWMQIHISACKSTAVGQLGYSRPLWPLVELAMVF
jgi:hypothetical protein